MTERMLVVLIAIAMLGGCKSKTETAGDATPAGSTSSQSKDSAVVTEAPGNPTGTEAGTPQYGEPPAIDVGLSVDEAYAAIPHRRTVWVESNSTVPTEEKAYLKVIFEVMDQAIAVRVAGLQSFSAQQFDKVDPVANYDQLIMFVRSMPVPKTLMTYHQKILDGLWGQQQFFADWRSARDQFRFAQQIGSHAGARHASAALRAAYNELMSKYPNESPTNKDAFFDYHCALDFL